jgi:hypothetical protein
MNRFVVVGLALVLAAAAVAAGGAASPARLTQPGVELGVLGGILLGAAMLWRPVLLTPAMVGVAAPTVLAALDGHSATFGLVTATTLLVATGEVAGWAIDRRSIVPEGRAVTARRATTTAATAGGAAVVSGGVLAAGGLPAPGGALPVVAGTLATLAVLALAALRRW